MTKIRDDNYAFTKEAEDFCGLIKDSLQNMFYQGRSKDFSYEDILHLICTETYDIYLTELLSERVQKRR